jgi:hypothetical protein
LPLPPPSPPQGTPTHYALTSPPIKNMYNYNNPVTTLILSIIPFQSLSQCGGLTRSVYLKYTSYNITR